MSSKGQVVIPKEIREAVNLQPDSLLLFEVDKKERKITISIAPDIETIRGFFRGKKKFSDEELREAIEQGWEEEIKEKIRQGRL